MISELSDQSAFVKGEAESVEEKLGALVTYYNRITTAITSTTAATFFLHYNIGLICDSILSLYPKDKKASTVVFKTRFGKSYQWGARHAQLFNFVHTHPILLRVPISWNDLHTGSSRRLRRTRA